MGYPRQLLLVNVYPRNGTTRAEKIRAVQAAFHSEGMTLRNVYQYVESSGLALEGMNHEDFDAYTEQLINSTFVFSPDGQGHDCYRHYEALAAGAIPVVDDSWFLRRVLTGLPAVFVKNWSSVTPTYLRLAHREALSKAEKGAYDYRSITANRITKRIRYNMRPPSRTENVA